MNIKNNYISLGFYEKDKNIQLNSIFGNNTEFIKDITDNYLWQIEVKKKNDIQGEIINLYPKDSDELIIEEEEEKIIFTWNNVKTEDMTSGYNVVVTVKLKYENSYWHINVSENEEYGIWTVIFPRITDIDANTGDVFLVPLRGGCFPINQFSEEGFNAPINKNNAIWTREIGYGGPAGLQYGSFTKGDTTLYFSHEDNTFYQKDIFVTSDTANHINYITKNYAEYMALDEGFDLTYKLNMAIVQGDWYNSAKKYRNWAIKNNHPVFKKGPIEKRKDIPNWLKDNAVWFRVHCYVDNCFDSLNKSIDFMEVPCSVHVYQWPDKEYDTFYPDFLPPRPFVPGELKKLHDKGIKYMTYTNAHIIDINQSPSFKKYGHYLLAQKPDGTYAYESWASDKGANNNVACIGTEYYNILMNEYINIIKELDIDALYMDQVGGCGQPYCFNKTHNHPNGGDWYTKRYNKFIKEIKEKYFEIKGKNLPIATEDANEAIDFDMWLRVNDPMAANEYYPLSQTIFNGYIINYGDQSFYSGELIGWKEDRDINEWKDDDSYSARNKKAISLVQGNQFGWNEGTRYEVFNEKFGEYFKDMAKARYKAIKYFNLGELVRPVSITSEIPTRTISYNHFSGLDYFDFKLVKTGSFSYKDKTIIVFTNVSVDESIHIDWTAKAEDLNLKDTNSYFISELYPNETEEVEINELSGKFTIKPSETKIFVVRN